MKKYFCILLLLPLAGWAQLVDDFNDGDFTNNPTWTGDVAQFIVNPALQLQLSSSGTGSSYLVTANNLGSLNDLEWQFYIRINLSPSANNNARVYLVSDQSNLKGSLNGYYLQFGENLSNDAIELFRQTGAASVSVARGTNGFIASAFIIRVKVTRDNTGLWKIYADAAAGTNFQLQAQGNDATFNNSSWFGVVCNYTSSTAANIYFDDVYSGPVIVDVTPPSVSSVTVTGQSQVDVKFSEAVEQVSAETVSNYSVNNGIGNPSSASRDGSDFSVVHLTFSSSFQNGVNNLLSVLNVKDLNNNAITVPSTASFAYFIPVPVSAFDLVINEIMADPNPPQGLPDYEYLELYNRKNYPIDLTGWTITAGSTIKTFSAALISPSGYLLLCVPAAVSELQAYGTTVPIFTSSTTLSNTGTYVVLKDNSGVTIDSVKYELGWYRDGNKDDGGYSLERIDPDYTCHNALNWIASNSPLGGSPGSKNSVKDVFTDTQTARMTRAYISGPNKVIALFSKPMNTVQISTAALFSADNGLGAATQASLISSVATELTFNVASFQKGIIYTLTCNASITDCPGNAIQNTQVRFALPDTSVISDFLINEVLYHPFSVGAEFIELYNRSLKVLDLSQHKLSEINITTGAITATAAISETPFLFFPGDYMVLTKNPDGVKNFYTTPNPDNFISVSSFPALNDDGDAFTVTNLSGIRVDEFSYTPDYQFPLLNDDTGVSLERISFNRPTQDKSNWHSAAETIGFATPAYENSQHAELIDDGSEVSVAPQVFSPDNDGRDDVVNIIFNFSEPGFVANVFIYDAKGRVKKQVANNVLVGISGSFAWDGVDADTQKAPAGIYIAYVELVNPSGKVKKIKKPFVLAAKL